MAYKKPENKQEGKNEVVVTEPTESTPVTIPTTSIVDESISSLKEENNSLKKQMEEMKAQLKMMAEMISTSRTSVVDSTPKAEKFIPIINLSTGVLVLRGTTVHIIEGQFTSVTFREREARAIMNNARNVFIKGYAWIADEEFMKEYDLDVACANVLSAEKMKKILDNTPEYIVEVYQTVPDAQKQIILSMIEDKRIAGQYIDANILTRLSEVSGRDLINPIPTED